MSFGFPAYHEIAEKFDGSIADLNRIAREAIDRLGWQITGESFSLIEASVPANLLSFGEKLTVSIGQDGAMTITSKCIIPTQIFDWGKNKRNVEKFVEKARELERSVSADLRRASPAGDGITPLTKLFDETR